MKFYNVLLLALAAMVQAEPVPEPQPGIIGDIASKFSSIVDGVQSDVDVGLSRGREARTSHASWVISSLTSEAGSRISSLESVAATANSAVASSAHREISKISQSLGSATSSAAKVAAHDKSDPAPAPTVFVAMGAMVGGAAVLLNM